VAGVAAWSAGARAETGLAAPSGKVLLTVDGNVSRRNAGTSAVFDLAMLDALPQGRFRGETPWTRGTQDFSGPLFRAVLAACGAQGEQLSVVALNDYSAFIPMSDLRSYDVILATRRSGAEMAVRERGPLWIVYPMDTDPSLRNQAIYARSVWQVARIMVS
jgi:hypothetical protein